MNDLMIQMPIGVYIHVPFCVRKCFYCDFLSAPSDEQTREKYVDALCAEIRAQASLYQNHTVKTVFFGGGTPSLLSGEQIGRIMEELRRGFHFADAGNAEYGKAESVEITMEANPGTLTVNNLKAYRAAGINRLSIGLQSSKDEELRLLGRIHTWKEFLDNFQLARKAGFGNLNIDLMSALPGQTIESWQETVKRVAGLQPEHISAYSLIVEEGTPFYEWYGESAGHVNHEGGHPQLPSEEEDRAMYAWTKEFLASQGYVRYEFSNYARVGFECRHNSSYWKRTDYVGFGLGASSFCRNQRWKNISDLETYLKYSGENGMHTGIKEELSELSLTEQIEEFMFLGLRMSEGISCRKFEECFERSVMEVYGNVIEKLMREGLIGRSPDGARLYLTEYGVDVSNYVLAEFLLDQ